MNNKQVQTKAMEVFWLSLFVFTIFCILVPQELLADDTTAAPPRAAGDSGGVVYSSVGYTSKFTPTSQSSSGGGSCCRRGQGGGGLFGGQGGGGGEGGGRCGPVRQLALSREAAGKRPVPIIGPMIRRWAHRTCGGGGGGGEGGGGEGGSYSGGQRGGDGYQPGRGGVPSSPTGPDGGLTPAPVLRSPSTSGDRSRLGGLSPTPSGQAGMTLDVRFTRSSDTPERQLVREIESQVGPIDLSKDAAFRSELESYAGSRGLDQAKVLTEARAILEERAQSTINGQLAEKNQAAQAKITESLGSLGDEAYPGVRGIGFADSTGRTFAYYGLDSSMSGAYGFWTTQDNGTTWTAVNGVDYNNRVERILEVVNKYSPDNSQPIFVYGEGAIFNGQLDKTPRIAGTERYYGLSVLSSSGQPIARDTIQQAINTLLNKAPGEIYIVR